MKDAEIFLPIAAAAVLGAAAADAFVGSKSIVIRLPTLIVAGAFAVYGAKRAGLVKFG